MSKKIRRGLAFMLSLLMVFSSVYFGQSWADGDDDSNNVDVTFNVYNTDGSPYKGNIDLYTKNDDSDELSRLDTKSTNDSGEITFTVSKSLTRAYLHVSNSDYQIVDKGLITAKTEDGKLEPFYFANVFQKLDEIRVEPRSITINVKKVDANKNPLSGAVFTCTESGSTNGEEKTTGSDGLASWTLTTGKTYVIKETKAPNGYVNINWATEEFKASYYLTGENYENQTFTVVNNKDMYLQIRKKDNGNTYLNGAVFELYKVTDNGDVKIAEGTTATVKNEKGVDEDGVVRFEAKDYPEITPGNVYYAIETKAPDGYRPYIGKIPFNKKGDPLQGSTAIAVSNEKATKIYLLKNGEDDKTTYLAGAEFALYEEIENNGVKVFSDTPIKTFVTTDSEDGVEVDGLEVGKTYKLAETKAPDGYELDEQYAIIDYYVKNEAGDGYKALVSKSNTVGNVSVSGSKIIFTDTKKTQFIDVTFSKVDENNKQIAGAKIGLYERTSAGDKLVVFSDGTQNPFVTVVTNKPYIFNLPAGKYVFKELETPAGYATSSEKQFTLVKNAVDVSMVDESTVAKIAKLDIHDKQLPGAKLQIINKNDSSIVFEGKTIAKDGIVKEFTSTDEAEIIKNLPIGTYTVHEVEAPDGYELGRDAQLIVLESNTAKEPAYAQIIDAKVPPRNTLQITKKNTEGAYLQGATIAVYKVIDDDYEGVTYQTVDNPYGKYSVDVDITDTIMYGDYELLEIARIPSTELGATVYPIENLENGTYFVKEIAAPNGYVLDDTYHKVVFDSEDNAQKECGLVNKPTKVVVEKIDEDGTRLTGARLQIKDENGNVVVQSWDTTDENPKTIVGMLAVGKTYYISEVSAPEGYSKADEKAFVVKKTTDAQTYQLVNEKNYLFTLNISKLCEGLENEYVENAELTLTKVSGESNIKIASWTTSEGAKVISEQTYGKYTLTETKTPSGYLTADPVNFELTKDGNIIINGETISADDDGNVYVDMYDEYTTVVIKKLASTISGDPLEVLPEGTEKEAKMEPAYGAVLKIVDSNNRQVGADQYIISENENEIVLRATLDPGKTYKIIELDAPGRYLIVDPMPIEIVNTADEQVFVMKDDTNTAHYNVHFKKVDSDNNVLDKEAVFNLYRYSEDNKEWQLYRENIKVKGEITLENVVWGQYKLTEISSPDGYKLANSVEFTLSQDPERTESGKNEFVKDFEIKDIVDKDVVVEFEKKDSQTGEYVKDASFEVYEVTEVAYANGSVDLENSTIADEPTYSFKSNGEKLTVSNKFKTNTIYVVKETAAPEGYETAEPIVFATDNSEKVHNVLIRDKQIEIPTYTVYIAKLSKNTKVALSGAELALYKVIDGQEVQIGNNWITTRFNNSFELEPGVYRVKEVKAPDGYKYAGNANYAIEFTIGGFDDLEDSENVITSGNGTKTVEIFDDYTKVTIEKKDGSTGNLLAGATLQILDEEGNVVVDNIVTKAEPVVIENKLVAGKTYYIHEVDAPKNYVINKNDKEFTVGKYNNVTVEFINEKEVKTYDITISKKDVETNAWVVGANLKLVKKTDNGDIEIRTWRSTNEAYTITGLTPGDYVLTETSAPYEKGYIINEKGLSFTLNEDGTSQTDYTLTDDYTKVEFIKIDEKGNNVVGAELRVVDKDGNVVVPTWTTTTSRKIIERFPIGTYYLEELKAPEGYKVSERQEFTVKAIGTVQTVVMTDYKEDVKTYDVNISKQDIANRSELADAKLVVTYTKNNKVVTVDSWTSTNESHKISGLVENVAYTLTETKAPDGYVKAESIVFMIKNNEAEQPIIYIKNADNNFVELGSITDGVVMYDDYTKVNVEKVDSKKNPVVGAKLEVHDKDGKVVESFTSAEKAYEIKRLPVGKYTLVETKAPNGYEVADPVDFEVTETGDVLVVSMTDLLETEITYYDLIISKKDITGTKEVPGATLVLTDKSGKEVDRWISGETAHKIKVKYGEYTLTEIQAPDGYVKAESIKIVLNENGKSKSVYTMVDDYTKVEIYKQDTSSKANISGAKLELYGPDGKLVESWTTDGSVKKFTGLAHGEYVLREIEAPNDYQKANDIKFTVTDNAGTVKVYMYDSKKVTPTPTPNPTPTPTVTPTVTHVPTVTPTTTPTVTATPVIVQTGDDNNVLPYILGGMLLLGLGCATAFVLRKKDD